MSVVGDGYAGKDWKTIIEETDWSDEKQRENFQNAIINTDAYQIMICDAHPDVYIVSIFPFFHEPLHDIQVYI